MLGGYGIACRVGLHTIFNNRLIAIRLDREFNDELIGLLGKCLCLYGILFYDKGIGGHN